MQGSQKVINTRTVLLLATVTIATLAAFVLSSYWHTQMNAAMGEFQDCSWVHTIPGPANCADDRRMAIYDDLRARSQVSFVFGLILLFGLISVPIVHGLHRGSADPQANKPLIPN